MTKKTQFKESSKTALEFFTVPPNQFRKSLEKAVGTIRDSSRKGADNLELFLSQEDRDSLSPLMHILNNAEIEYRRGNKTKIEEMESMLVDSYSGRNRGIEMLMVKADELCEIIGYYRDASALLEEKLYGKSALSSKNSLVPPSYTEPVSHLDYRTFEQLKAVRDSFKKIREI